MNLKDFKIQIVEDDPIIADDLQATLTEFGYEAFEPANNAKDALRFIKERQPNLCLLDVHLGDDLDGIQLASIIRDLGNIAIVFLTAFNDRKTIERIKVTNPAGYLVKPVDERNLQTTIELALHNFSQKDEHPETSLDSVQKDHIFIKIKDSLKKVLLSDIQYLEAYDNYVFLYTSDKKHLLSSSLKTVAEKLPKNSFMRVHRSYVINLNKIERIGSSTVNLGKVKVPIGKTYRAALMGIVDTL